MTPLDASSLEASARRRRFGQYLGRYRLGTLLGAGGSSSVYLARLEGPHAFGRLVALKVVHEHLLIDREFLTMLLDEANLSARLSHPGIAHTYELGEAGGLPFMAMEYLSGQPLSRLYRRAVEVGRPLSFALVAWIGACAARALHHAHELRDTDGLPLGIVHRDVSPENLFATRDGRVKVLDFGIATARHRRSSTSLGEIKGKFRYMAPEYTLGESVDRRLDVFALGATLYEIALGVPAFDGADALAVAEQMLSGALRDPRELRGDFPDALAGCLKRALAVDPAMRFRTLEDFALELDALARTPHGDFEAELGALVRDLFAEELESEAASVAELCALPRAPDPGDTDTTQVIATARRPRLPASRTLAALVVPALVALVALVALLLRRSPDPPAPDMDRRAAALPSTPAAASSSEAAALATGRSDSAKPPAPPPPPEGSSSPAVVPQVGPAGSLESRSRRSPSLPARDNAAAAPSGIIHHYPFP